MLRDIRKQYEFSALDEKDMRLNPFEQFDIWMKEILVSQQLEPTAMVVSTVDQDFQVHSRVVLLKEFSENGFVFFTNYEGDKAKQMAFNNKISLLFFWATHERQIRIEGVVERISEQESIEYFKSRPIDSQIGAWASPQSQVVESHDYLDKRFASFREKYQENVPKPPHWGGYLVRPILFEFWQGRANRLHDRFRYSKDLEIWKISRLAP